ncbi:MAG TPA: sigma 54-interacting transcriptional regulator [Myxococcales bacterium]|nr:sigma 54-interacting transcriptional regulator [Myxococcales bacterium]
MPYLVFYRRGQELMRVALDRPRMTVGRSSSADVVVPDQNAAPMQAAIVQEGGRFALVDLSGGRTEVAGKPVERQPLSDGMDIAVGSFHATFREVLEDIGGVTSKIDTLGSGDDDGPSLPKEIFLTAQEVGGGKPIQVPLGSSVTIGSASAVGLRLDHPTVSGKHARVTRQEGRLMLTDVGSRNGTWLNGMRLYEAELPLGVRFRIGPFDVWASGAAPTRKEQAEEFEGILSQDPGMRAIFAQIDRVAQTNASVVVTGETGTGKELVARAVHRRSRRAGASFIPVNCGAIAHELMEAELFGHEKGAYTGAVSDRAGALKEADGGTLFLDEIAELPRDLQPKLLRAVELGEIKPVGASRPGTVDVRYVCASHRNLSSEVRAQRFREDLFYRLAVATLQLPPLRQRRGDLSLLWAHFLEKLAPGQKLRLSDGARRKLEEHRWPGNVRELRNVAQRALLTSASSELGPEHILFDEAGMNGAGAGLIDPRGMTLEQVEASAIAAVLRQLQGNRRLAAKQLGIAKSTLLKKIADYGLKHEGLPAGAPVEDD